MVDYVVSTNPDEQAALEWVASQADPPQDPEIYFDARMHEVLRSYQQQYAVQNAAAPVEDVAVAYAKADTPTQEQVNTLLGVQVQPVTPEVRPA